MQSRFLLAALLLPAFAAGQPTASAPKPALPVPPSLAKKPTVLEAKGFLGVIGQTIAPQATLRAREGGAGIPGKKVSFTIAGRVAGVALTGASGEVQISYHVSDNPPPGTIPVEIQFAGDDAWMPATASVTLGVFKASTQLTLESVSGDAWEGQTANLSGRLSRTPGGDAVGDRVVSLSIDGKQKGTPTTDHFGSFEFRYAVPAGSSPRIVVKAQFDGDALHAASSRALDLLVNPLTTLKKGTFRWSDVRVTCGETITLKGLLLPQNPMLSVNGQAGGLSVNFFADLGQDQLRALCSAISAPDGIVRCDAKLDVGAGTYPIVAHSLKTPAWNADDYGSGQLTLDPRAVHLAVNAPASAKIGDKVVMKARLTDRGTGAPIANVEVHQGEPMIKTKTNASGEALANVTISNPAPFDKIAVTASFLGGGCYQHGEGSALIKVTPKLP